MKRGQSALEYLVTYGWAILAIVIISAILWYLGIFNPSKYTAEKQCSGFATFSCIDFSLRGSNGNLSIVLGNRVGSRITSIASNAQLQNGTSVTGTCPSSLNPNAHMLCYYPGLLAGTVGDSYDQINVFVNYTSTSGIVHQDSGFVKGKFE